jgi:hypothetical protein
MTLTGEWYHNRFIKQVVVDVGQRSACHQLLQPQWWKILSNSAQVEMSYPFFDGFTFYGAYRYTRAKSDFINSQTGEVQFLAKPLMNDYKGWLPHPIKPRCANGSST